MVGHKVGESFDVNVTFPTEYHSEELAGKDATFKVTIKELKRKELPPWTTSSPRMSASLIPWKS